MERLYRLKSFCDGGVELNPIVGSGAYGKD